MPAFLAPHKSGAHRVTAIALYRALLSKCRAVPPTIDSTALCNVVRNTFARNRHVTSTYSLRNAFAGGYEALDHLDSAIAGNKSSISYLTSLLSQLPGKLKASPSAAVPPSSNPKPAAPGQPTPAPPGAALAVRPRPAFSLPSKRRVPVLISANKIPILRFTKPQPHSLSKYIKSRVVDRQKRQDRKAALEVSLQIAKGEDEWDRIVAREAKGKIMGMKGDPRWTEEVYTAIGDVISKIDEEGEKNRKMAEKMVEIVDRERELAEVERKARRREKNEERRKRKAERENK